MASQAQQGAPSLEDLLKGILDQQVTMSRQMAEQQQLLQQQISSQNTTIEQMLVHMKELGEKTSKSPISTPRSSEGGDESGCMEEMGTNRRHKETDQMLKSPIPFNPRIEFPFFDGSNPRSWIKKCSKYFCLCKTPPSQKVEIASLYMSGKAELWFNGYAMCRPQMVWEEFVVDVCARFGDELGSQVVEDFNKLTQLGSIDQYLERFEDLKSLMLLKNPTLPPDYFVDSFVGGLSPQLK